MKGSPMRLMAMLAGLAVVALLAMPAHANDMSRAGVTDGVASPCLYDRLGGRPAIVAVIADLVERVAADKRINWKFAFTNVSRLTTMIVDHLCQTAGGPCTYPGHVLTVVLTDLALTGEQFDILVDHLVISLDKLKVGEREKTELLGLVRPMKKDVVAGLSGALAHTVSAP